MIKNWPLLFALMGLAVLCLCVSACSGEKSSPADPVPAVTNGTDSLSAQKTKEILASKQEEVAGGPERKTVLDYFRHLPEPYALPYTLAQKDRLWYATHLPSGQEQQALVDLPNGYLELSYLKNDTVSQSVQAALFRMENRSPVLGICQTDVLKDQVAQSCSFLRPDHPDQLDWTEHTMPVIATREFFSESTPGLDSEYLEDAFPVLLKLPQYGTELLVQPYLGRRFYYCGEQASAAEQKMCPLYDQLERRSFTMNWNRAADRFQ
jgi:hypothetical protein